MSDDIKHIISKNELNTLFFSEPNKQIIHNAIRKYVYDKSNYMISKQSDRELDIVMRSVYLLYGKNQPTHITEQIDSLNKIVIEECVPRIISNVQQYLNYKKNINNIPIPMEHPKSMNKGGRNTYSLTQF